jgi:hypothetical protein
VLLVGAGTFLAVSRAQQVQESQTQPTEPSTELAAVSGEPRIVFRNTALGTQYGTVAMVPLSDVSGPRAYAAMSRDRVSAASGNTLCLASDRAS